MSDLSSALYFISLVRVAVEILPIEKLLNIFFRKFGETLIRASTSKYNLDSFLKLTTPL